ncbi:MAG TPA: Hsp20/alpha crystallin family protein [Abditibacteriaceae bacterium]|jgi:HSP20 family protein
MSLIRYTHPMMHLQQQINRMFDQFDNDLFGRLEGLGEGMFTPPVDIKEDADAYTVHLEVPGVSQDNLHLSLQDNVLTIRGSKEQKQESGEGRYRRIERSYGSFARSLSLPRNVDATRVEANLEDGVLEVRLPKREESKPRQINVGVTQNAGLQTVVAQNAGSQNDQQQETPTQDGTSTQKDTAPVDGNEQAVGGNSEDAPEGNPT